MVHQAKAVQDSIAPVIRREEGEYLVEVAEDHCDTNDGIECGEQLAHRRMWVKVAVSDGRRGDRDEVEAVNQRPAFEQVVGYHPDKVVHDRLPAPLKERPDANIRKLLAPSFPCIVMALCTLLKSILNWNGFFALHNTTRLSPCSHRLRISHVRLPLKGHGWCGW